jgi:prephenate dehydrogenase
MFRHLMQSRSCSTVAAMQSFPPPDVLQLDRIAVSGLGLIGGSVIKGLRAAGYSGRLTGFDTDAATMQQALESGCIDEACAEDALFAGNDLVVLCQPVTALVAFLARWRDAIAAGRAVVVDVASVKAPVAAALAGTPAAVRFVPCHPIAGRAVSGWAAALPHLFQERLCVLTPLVESAPRAVALAQDLWGMLGARLTQLTPQRHDRIYAALSHLPQVLSYAYLHSLAMREDSSSWLNLRGPGLQSFARLGGSDPRLWTDIALHNAQPLAEEIDRICQSLTHFRQLLTQRRGAELHAAFALAQGLHRAGGLAADAPPTS